jgi:hypothetical protein
VEEGMVVQAPIQEHGMNIEDQINEPMGEDDDATNIVDHYGTNILI